MTKARIIDIIGFSLIILFAIWLITAPKGPKVYPVESSFIETIAYDDDCETLIIEMENGKKYEYIGVPVYDFIDMRKAESVGEYYNKHIKGHYDVIEVTGEE